MRDVLEDLLASSAEISSEPAAGTVQPSLGTRLWFVWLALLALVITVVFSLCHFVNYRFRPTARTFKRWAGWWGRAILRGAGLRVKVEQHAALDPEQPCVFVVNHQNALDIPAVAGYLPASFGFVAKAELSRVPFLAFALRHSPSLFIDRSHPRRSLESIRAAGRRIREGTSVLIFAEGARAFGPHLLPFKKGAFILAAEAGVPVVPVTLVDAWRLLDERRGSGRPGTLHLVVGEAIPMAGKTRRDVPGVMDEVRVRMNEYLAPEEQRPSDAVS
jgi:1-acyl-sn-glycerol-3-phosphate acyltransferase